MKKIIYILLILMFLMSACSKPGLPSPSSSGIGDYNIVRYSFDELIMQVDAVVIAKLESQEVQDFDADANPDYCSIFSYFNVESVLFGENIAQEIECFSFGYYINDNRDYEHASKNVYVPGERYLLLLSRFDVNPDLSQAPEGELYQFESQYIFLPLGDLSKSHMLNEEGKIELLFNEAITEGRLVEHILNVKN